MDLTVVICVSEILGSVDLYRVAPVVIALAAIRTCRQSGQRDDPSWGRSEEPAPLEDSGGSDPSPRVANVAALVAVSVVIAEWSTQTVSAYHHGMLEHGHAVVSHAVRGPICPGPFHNGDALLRFASRHGLLPGVIGVDPLTRHSLAWGMTCSRHSSTLFGWVSAARIVVHRSPISASRAITLTGSAILFATPGTRRHAAGGRLRRCRRARVDPVRRCPAHQLPGLERQITAGGLGHGRCLCWSRHRHEVDLHRTSQRP